MGSVTRRAAKRDGNERPIIDALRAAGASIEELSKKDVCDLLAGFQGRNYLIEVKSDKGKLTDGQKKWIAAWKGTAYVVRTIEEALEVLKR